MSSKIILPLVIGASLIGLSTVIFYAFVKKEGSKPSEKPVRNRIIVPVPREQVTLLIGLGGEKIKSIEAQSGCQITLTDDDLQSSTRECVLEGGQDAIDAAQRLIREFLEHQSQVNERDITVPAWAVNQIVGSKGENLKTIKQKSSTVISVIETDGDEPKTIRIKGLPEQIQSAESMINKVVDEVKEFRANLAKREPRAKETIDINYEKLNDTESTSKLMEVYVSALENPGKFWVQVVGPKATELDALVHEMTDYYADATNQALHRLGVDSALRVGEIVASFFRVDSKCYRAEVIAIKTRAEGDGGETYVEVFFVDYGDTDIVRKKDIFRLRTDFLQLPFQAIECFLANVQPSTDAWPEEAIDEFESLAHVAQWKKLSSKVVNYKVDQKLLVCYKSDNANGAAERVQRNRRESSPVPGIELYDHVKNGDVNIADELVRLGYAVYEAGSPTRARTPRSSSKQGTPVRESPEPKNTLASSSSDLQQDECDEDSDKGFVSSENTPVRGQRVTPPKVNDTNELNEASVNEPNETNDDIDSNGSSDTVVSVNARIEPIPNATTPQVPKPSVTSTSTPVDAKNLSGLSFVINGSPASISRTIVNDESSGSTTDDEELDRSLSEFNDISTDNATYATASSSTPQNPLNDTNGNLSPTNASTKHVKFNESFLDNERNAAN